MKTPLFRQPYDENYNPAQYATPVGYELDSNPDKQNENALEASLTQQSFRDECDINNIVRSYEKTGFLPTGNGPTPRFDDISDAPSFLEAQNVVAAANEAFAALPAKMRERFNNDPSRLMAFLDDDDNYDEAVKLGLVTRPSPAPEKSAEAEPKGSETPPAA